MHLTSLQLTCLVHNYDVIVKGLLSTSQEIGWEEHLRNNLFCVEWDVKPELNQSAHGTAVHKSWLMLTVYRPV